MNGLDIKQIDSQYIASTYARFPLQLVSGKGSLLYDEKGNEYIDMGSGIAVNSFGTADSQWINAVTEQLGKLQHTSNLYYTEPCALLAKELCERTGMKKLFFSNSGAEANECAIKAARKYHEDKKDGKSLIITLKNSFHGRTVTTLAATGQDVFHESFLPLTDGFAYADAFDTAGLLKLCSESNPAAIMMELIQGEGGVYVLEKKFVEAAYDYCKNNDCLLIIDEVQTGNGRTGELYAYMNYGICPDIVSTAKGLAGGLPLGATMLGERAENVFTPGTHGSTFGGNPICCAGALNVLSRIDEKLLADVREKSDYIVKNLTGAKGIKGISGMGLMLGIETEKPNKEVLALCREKGLLVLTAKTKIRLLPPLNIPFELVKKAVEIIKEACA